MKTIWINTFYPLIYKCIYFNFHTKIRKSTLFEWILRVLHTYANVIENLAWNEYLPIYCRRLFWYRLYDGEVGPRMESVVPTIFAQVSVCYPYSNCNTTGFYVSSLTTKFVVRRPRSVWQVGKNGMLPT